MVQAVVRAEPGLRDCAIALIEGTPPLRNVMAANDAALRAGIELGMTESQAEDFCAVQIRLRSPVQEKTAHAALMDLGWSVSPRVEDTAPDTIVLDLAGLASLFGSEEMIAERLIERASGLGLAARVAIASNLETAIHAARGFPGVTLIPAGRRSEKLGGLPVGVLVTSDGLSPRAEILETLDSWGVRTCGALAALPVLSFPSGWGRKEFVCTNWHAVRVRERWCWLSRIFILRRRWSLRMLCRSWSLCRFCWGGCSINCARGLRRVRWLLPRFACDSSWSLCLKIMCAR